MSIDIGQPAAASEVYAQIGWNPDATFEVYAQIGRCEGGPNTPIGTLTSPANVYECWAACLVWHPEELVAADFWPQAPLGRGGQRCWCQTACDSLDSQYHNAGNPVELALRKGVWQTVLPTHLVPGLGMHHFF